MTKLPLARLIGMAVRAGYAISVVDGQPKLTESRRGAKIPDRLLADLKERRQEIIDWFQSGGVRKDIAFGSDGFDWSQVEIVQTGEFDDLDVGGECGPLFGPSDDNAFDEMQQWNEQVGIQEPKVNGAPKRPRKKR